MMSTVKFSLMRSQHNIVVLYTMYNPRLQTQGGGICLKVVRLLGGMDKLGQHAIYTFYVKLFVKNTKKAKKPFRKF